ncbi:MAG: GYD domain-containing protein [Chloroflexi bacterium]|nr:GYD domain-containing protein [Chloroflexota bacterium]
MAKFLFQVSYTKEGLEGLLKEGGTRRREAVEQLFASVGGSLETFYYAFGDNDLYMIVDLPDDEAATAASLTVGASGAGSIKTTVLMTPESIDDAVLRTVAFRPPGS